MSVLRHSLWAGLSAVVLTGSRFALAAILARRLSTGAFGQFAYSQWLSDIGFLVCTLGATGVISRYAAEYRSQPALLASVLRKWRPYSVGLPFLGSLAAALGVWLSGVPLNIHGYLLLLSWGFATGLWNMQTAALMGLQRFDLVLAANLLASTIMVMGSAFLPFDRDNLAAVFTIMTAAATAASTVGIKTISLASRGASGALSTDQSTEILRYAINVWFTALLWSFAWSRGEIPVVRAMLGDDAVARYSVALTLYGGAVAGVMLGVSGIAPEITRRWSEGKRDQAVSLCRTAMDLQLLVTGLTALTLIWFAPELMRLAFGTLYRDSAFLLGVLAVGLPSLTLASHNHLMLVITGARFTRNTTLFGVLLLLGLACAGAWSFGLVGAAWSRAATLLVLGGITVYVSWRRWGPAALGLTNVVLVMLASFASVLCSLLQIFDALPTRTAVWGVLSLAMILWVKNESGQLVAMSVAMKLWGRSKR